MKRKVLSIIILGIAFASYLFFGKPIDGMTTQEIFTKHLFNGILTIISMVGLIISLINFFNKCFGHFFNPLSYKEMQNLIMKFDSRLKK